MENLVISIITVTYNSCKTLRGTIESVLNQDYPNIEYIVVDGGSVDGTIEIIESYGNKVSKFISERDNGMYDAINKGVRLSSGKIIGIVNSDDFFTNTGIVSIIASAFTAEDIDSIYGDVQFVDPLNLSRILRYYSSKHFKISKFKYGFMPAHPSFYAKRELFEKYGYYKTDYKIAADYELLMRFMLVNQIRCKYLEMPFVNMRTGGVSNKTIFSNYLLNKEILRACSENGVRTNYANIYSKYLFKIFEFIGN